MLTTTHSRLLIATGVIAASGIVAAAVRPRSPQPWQNTLYSTASPLSPGSTAPPYESITPVPAAASYEETASNDGYYATLGRPVYVRAPAPPPPPAYQLEEPTTGSVVYGPEPGYPTADYAPRHAVYSTHARRHRGRSKAKSVAIVAGSAGVGAAIGAIAGGGPGAAIGGISGGAAGFIYDRLTHKH